jgi:hypothetical protein
MFPRDRDATRIGRQASTPILLSSSSTMSQQPFLTSAGWSLDGLVMKGSRFHEIPRISISDKNLDAILCKHETSGVPLVIEGMREHRAWPSSMFDIQWIRRNVKQRELSYVVRCSTCDIWPDVQVRNVHDRRDLDVSFEEFMNHIGSISNYASTDGQPFCYILSSANLIKLSFRNFPVVCKGYRVPRWLEEMARYYISDSSLALSLRAS